MEAEAATGRRRVGRAGAGVAGDIGQLQQFDRLRPDNDFPLPECPLEARAQALPPRPVEFLDHHLEHDDVVVAGSGLLLY